MKIEPQKPKPPFNPLTLTLETPKEIAALFALVNHCDLTEVVGLADADWSLRIRDANKAAGNPVIDYQGLHSALCSIVKRSL